VYFSEIDRVRVQKLQTIRLPFSANIKLLLVLLALAIVVGTLYYVQQLVDELRAAEQTTLMYYANSIQLLNNTPSEQGNELDVISELAYRTSEILYFPVILTDAERKPFRNPLYQEGRVVGHEWLTKNVDLDTTLSVEEQERLLLERIEQMGKSYEPLTIYAFDSYLEEVSVPIPGSQTDTTGPRDTVILRSVTDTSIAHYLYYDDSPSITQLQLLPWIELLIISMFVIIGYISFSHIKRSEQSNIWVGMARETAHQLGTPLSSLMGWIELLRFDPTNTDQVLEAADEMDRDVERLTTVAQRFSKIGSAAKTDPLDLNEVIARVTHYFERRLPHLGKKISLVFEPWPEKLEAKINLDLMQWVFENLIRNAADAIERKEGTIMIRAFPVRDGIQIEISDNGKGIDPKIRKDIFRPGFSTKQRGWGLGLSLARRIVEEYHGGKIWIRESSPEGTTFAIRLER